jgi:hypothetical protein
MGPMRTIRGLAGERDYSEALTHGAPQFCLPACNLGHFVHLPGHGFLYIIVMG